MTGFAQRLTGYCAGCSGIVTSNSKVSVVSLKSHGLKLSVCNFHNPFTSEAFWLQMMVGGPHVKVDMLQCP